MVSTSTSLHSQLKVQLGYHICLFGRVYVRLDCYSRQSPVTKRYYIRYWQNIPDPLLGPKDVRPLLLFRAYTG